MHILITGGTGFIGSHLLPHLKQLGPVTLLTRNSKNAWHRLGHNVKCISSLSELNNLDDFYAVINLAGEPIAGKRWSTKQKQRIEQSRVETTEKLVTLLNNSSHKPKVFISGSAVGYYGDKSDQFLPETERPASDDFSSTVCQNWENAALKADNETRLCIIRTGLVLGREHGVLKKMLPAYQMGVGGPMGSGEQYIPWIHIKDMVRLILFLLETESTRGIFNACAPEPVTNRAFSQALAKALNRPNLIKTPASLLKLLLGEMSTLLLSSQRAIPEHLQQSGFTFFYDSLDPALADLLCKKRFAK